MAKSHFRLPGRTDLGISLVLRKSQFPDFGDDVVPLDFPAAEDRSTYEDGLEVFPAGISRKHSGCRFMGLSCELG